MNNFFEELLNMSITGTVVIGIIIIARFLLKGAPRKYSYMLWAVAGFRLCCPFSFKSVISIFNINPFQKPSDIVTSSGAMNYIDSPIIIRPSNIPEATVGGADSPASITVTSSAFNSFTDFIPYIWLIGFIAFIAYAIISYVRLRNNLSTATKYEDNIYQSEAISSPFILGIIKPRIYIPYDIHNEYLEYVIAHEKYHLKRFDNVIKVFAFVVLAMHWFNPFCYLAFSLMSRDMEMSCDEWVLSHNESIKKQYSTALLSFATGKKFPSPSPLCFGEASAQSRIKNVLKFKKPTLVVTIIALVLCLVVATVCIANPSSNKENQIAATNTEAVLNVFGKTHYYKSFDKGKVVYTEECYDRIEKFKHSWSLAWFEDETTPKAKSAMLIIEADGEKIFNKDIEIKRIDDEEEYIHHGWNCYVLCDYEFSAECSSDKNTVAFIRIIDSNNHQYDALLDMDTRISENDATNRIYIK